MGFVHFDQLITLARVTGKAKRPDVIDAVSPSFTNRNNVISCDRRLSPFRKRDDRPVPFTSGASGVACQQLQPLPNGILSFRLDEPRPATLGENMPVTLLAR